MTSSSEEETHHKQRAFISSSSTPHICLMARGMKKSDVSDDDSSPSHELMELVRSQEVAITKLVKTNEELKEKLTSSSSNYNDLAARFDELIKENDKLMSKVELLEKAKTTSSNVSTSFQKKPKMDASTSCIDLIDKSCSPCCNETCAKNVVVDSCDDLIAQENDELKSKRLIGSRST